MDYEKKYNEAFAWIRDIYPTLTGAAKEDAEHYFPELRESEDERIRRELIEYLRGDLDDITTDDTDRWITWIEKQKEQKPERINITEMVAKYEVTDEYVEGEYKGKPVNCMIRAYEQGIRDTLLKVKEQKPNYCHHWVDETGWTEEYRKAYYDGWNNCNMQHEQLKADQKPAEWSEKDKIIIEGACNALEIYGHTKLANMLKSICPQPKQEWNEYDNEMFHCICDSLCHLRKLYETNEDKVSDYNAMLEWFRNCFKFLRPSWKPSEEQMRCLCEVVDEAIRKYNSSVGGYPQAKILESLYKQLQNL